MLNSSYQWDWIGVVVYKSVLITINCNELITIDSVIEPNLQLFKIFFYKWKTREF